MAVYAVDIEKRLGSEFWSNRWIVNATNIASALAYGNGLVAAERALHSSAVLFTRFRLSNLGDGNEEYQIVPVSLSGQRTSPGSLLPLFNTLRVDMPASAGRPSRKYFRGVLAEGDIDGDAIQTAFGTFMAAFEALFANGTTNVDGVVDPQGQFLSDATPIPFVQMRQLRRGSRRRANGGGIFQ